jgi:hypothetical protein
LGQTGGGADGAADTIVINATGGDDTITVTNNNGVVTVSASRSKRWQRKN